MKALLLELDHAGRGFVAVLQPSRDKPGGHLDDDDMIGLRALAARMEPVRALERGVAAMGAIGVEKVIAEHICFDSNRAVDDGWLEPLP